MNVLFGNFRDRLLIEGLMPERALLRLKRADIAVYNVKKLQKNQILLSVKKKDSEKVFAIYPNVCYNIAAYSPYTVRKIGAEGLGRYVEKLKRRVGLLLGGLLFFITLLFLDSFTFGVDFVGTDVYRREVFAALEENGIKPFSKFDEKKKDLFCAQILAIDDVEFCSVKKDGFHIIVEIQTSPFIRPKIEKGSLIAKHTGVLLSVATLKGTPLKKSGEEVRMGEAIVGDWFEKADGEKVRVEAVARAKLACVYEGLMEADSKEEAFAKAYLLSGISESDRIEHNSVEKQDGGYYVKIEYTAFETINL